MADLAARQAELARALAAGGRVPSGFDAQRVEVAARALVAKRARALARAWPGLVRALGVAFRPRFRAYATANPPPEGGPIADGLAFTRSPGGRLPWPARLERLMAEMEYVADANGLRRRSWWVPCVRILIGRPAKFAVAVRLSGRVVWLRSG